MSLCVRCLFAPSLTHLNVLHWCAAQAICLHGQMSQPRRLAALAKFTSQKSDIIIATDVASRGLDIPHVDCVVNYDIPMHSKVGIVVSHHGADKLDSNALSREGLLLVLLHRLQQCHRCCARAQNGNTCRV